jgi:hypothetical protein
MIKSAFMLIGFIHVIAFLLGVTNFLHYRLYIGLEEKVIVSKAEYEALKGERP